MPLRLKEMVMAAKANIKEIDCKEAQDLFKCGGYKPLDVREAAEYLEGTIPMAVHIPRGMLEPICDANYACHKGEMADLDQGWVVFCAAGGRGALATDTMQKMGYTNVVNLAGGFAAWKECEGNITVPPVEGSLMRCDHPWNPGYQDASES
ncbi:rhodanese-like domain-containing protein [Thiomicrorhabdus sp. zzn3]|uniref:rhodanese-like domain-containing protein n=1 Tax=Thiomicrorhabdus sp. zzn3 TaxID=3039775 RepID=UPI0024364A66|nr:rhodanese-like domain-containing protein [Thiomicrorhabdus sp. zzn3]MDG6778622.1 rhodanese-like domain-containing protein [Thiomicrorhabdus sp. zzn3]